MSAIHVKRWRHMSHLVFDTETLELGREAAGFACPGCGHLVRTAPPGPLACDGCGNVYLVVAPTPS